MPASEAAGLSDPAYFVPPVRARSTRRFALAWLLTPVVWAVLWPVLTLGWVNRYDYGEAAWIDGMYRRKAVAATRAAGRADEARRPRLVVVGGSGTLLGVDAELLEMKLGVPVVNFGMHAGLATEYLLYRARRELRPGDSVLLCPEYQLWGYPAETFTDLEWAYVCSYDKRFLLDMDRRRALKVLYTLPLRDHALALRGWWKRVRGRHYQTRPGYNLGFVGPNGDLRAARPGTHFGTVVDYPFPDVRSAASVRYFRDFADWARANHVRVFMSWPNACRPDLPLAPGADAPPEEMTALLKELSFTVLDRPAETVFPRQWFTDTSYHCDAPTRRLRTEALARRLRRHFGLSPLPDRPTGFYLVASRSHRPRPGNAFAVDPGVDVKYLVADPIDHPDAVTPAQVKGLLDGGLPVYFDEPEVGRLLERLGRQPVEVARATASLPRWWREYGQHVFLIARTGGAAGTAAADALPAELARALGGSLPVVAAVGTGPYAGVRKIVVGGGTKGSSLHTDLRSLTRRDVPQLSLVIIAPAATATSSHCEVRINREDLAAPGPVDGDGVRVVVIDPESGTVVDAATFPGAGAEAVVWRMNRLDPPRQPGALLRIHPVLYNSFEFLLVFLPASLLLYFGAAAISRGLANGMLCALSLAFYAWWDFHRGWSEGLPWYDWRNWHNLLVLVGSILFNFVAGTLIKRRASKPVLVLGIAANLAVLGYFKYANFFLANLSAVTGHAFAPLAVALPLGISFFTFTQIAFLVDCYRGLAKELDLARYVLFVSFFPHLIAGPIVHHSRLMPQFSTDLAKRWNPANVHPGLAFFTLGLFKKVGIADACAPWAKAVFDAPQATGFLDAWRGSLAYSMQLYFDFSGYSDMAIGLGLLFNVRLPDNFDAPYRATSIADFWRRWHITLSRFLRDYLYIPLGGNRLGESRRRANLLVTMLLGGIWHGAGWTFAIWGLYHGLLLVIQRAWSARHAPMPPVLSRALTFLLVVVGWVFFRAPGVGKAGSMLGGMVGLNGLGHQAHARGSSTSTQWLVLAALLVFVNVAPTTKQWVESRELNASRAVALGTLFFVALMLMRTALLNNTPSPFIYFQF